MNREHWKELLPVITAFANGEELEMNHYGDVGWGKNNSPDFTAAPSCYRIAPKPRKVWINEYEDDGVPRFKAHRTLEDADDFASEDRIACHEIELPPLP